MRSFTPNVTRARQSFGAPAHFRRPKADVKFSGLRTAADGGAFESGTGVDPALTLAGVLALAGRIAHLAFALAFAGVNAGAAVGALRAGARDDRAGGEQRRGGGDDCALLHDFTPLYVRRFGARSMR